MPTRSEKTQARTRAMPKEIWARVGRALGALSDYSRLQREADGTKEEGHTRRWMCVLRQARSPRKTRQDAEVVVRCKYQWLSRERVLNKLEHTDQGHVGLTELVTVSRGISAVDRIMAVRRGARMVTALGYTVPTTCACDTYEQRK